MTSLHNTPSSSQSSVPIPLPRPPNPVSIRDTLPQLAPASATIRNVSLFEHTSLPPSYLPRNLQECLDSVVSPPSHRDDTSIQLDPATTIDDLEKLEDDDEGTPSRSPPIPSPLSRSAETTRVTRSSDKKRSGSGENSNQSQSRKRSNPGNSSMLRTPGDKTRKVSSSKESVVLCRCITRRYLSGKLVLPAVLSKKTRVRE